VNKDSPDGTPQQEWVAHHERLRSDALNRSHGISSGFGLTVFLRQGMAAWMRTCSRAVTPPVREFAQPGLVSSLSCEVRTQAVFILAGILLGGPIGGQSMQTDIQKIKPEHLKRDAYLYVRQSTLRQVLENSESTKRQYELRQRAIALGWHAEQIVVIDNDLGQSGASAVDPKARG
jgi:hypothetical protein